MEAAVSYIVRSSYWGFLVLAAVQDFRRKSIDLRLLGFFAILAAGGKGYVYMATRESGLLSDAAAGAGLGILLLGITAVSRGGIGIGDGVFFCVSGLMLGFWRNMMLFCISTMLCGIWGLWLVVRNQFSRQKQENLRKKSVPFIPFVLAAAICMEIGGRV